ncbi:MAG: GAF domain-containing sensor histidine kinase [Pseudomonadota bacterium]
MSPSTDVAAVQRIAIIPTVLETVAQITGLRFTCIARVTADSWTACAVLDSLSLGMQPGDALDVGATRCGEVVMSGHAVVIDHASQDPSCKAHACPPLFGFESYISVPILARDGKTWGTLFGLDPVPRELSLGPALASMSLFATLIAQQLKSQQELEATQVALGDVTAESELREQFIAILGHDLRNPIGNIITSADLMMRSLDNPARLATLARLVQGSGRRMAALVDDVVDLTRGKMGGGMALTLLFDNKLPDAISHVVDELRSTYPGRDIRFEASESGIVYCDAGRLAQLCSNLLKNALVYGDPTRPVGVSVVIGDAGLELSVWNHGPQMSQDTVSHLFEPYWRAKTGNMHQGLGLGLFIVGEIARRHGGLVTVASSPALTTFLFSLGAQDAEGCVATSAPAPGLLPV